jgi:hypothetical protein
MPRLPAFCELELGRLAYNVRVVDRAHGGGAMSTFQELGYNKLFVALDGSSQQDKVLDRAIVTAANDGAESTLVMLSIQRHLR